MATKDFTFESVSVKDEIQAQLKDILPKHNWATVKVLKGDPQSPAEVPCIGINRIEDSETAQSIADFNGTAYDANSKIFTTSHGSYFSESVEVRIWHTNADEREKLYKVVKASLYAMRPHLVEKGLLNVSLRSGRDEQDSSMAHAPMVLYWATITLSYLNPLDVNYSEVIEPITAIHNSEKLVIEGV